MADDAGRAGVPGHAALARIAARAAPGSTPARAAHRPDQPDPEQQAAAGVVSRAPDGRPLAVLGFTVRGGKIVEIDILADSDRLRQLDLAVLDN
jgi:RNA polymerase sigma-70 factor (ECF subfamily)